MPWNAAGSYSAGLRLYTTSSLPMYPLGIQGDSPGQACLPMGIAHAAPRDRLDQRGGRHLGDREGFVRWMHVDPPKAPALTSWRLRNVMRRLEGAVAILDHRLRHAVLARPSELTQCRSDPTDWIPDDGCSRRTTALVAHHRDRSPSLGCFSLTCRHRAGGSDNHRAASAINASSFAAMSRLR
jgi:hypothetical protein